MTASPSESRPWLRTLAPRWAAKWRLFLFPHAGGASIFYTGWAATFGSDVELVVVQPPGREDRLAEAPFREMKPLVEVIAREIVKCGPLPFALFGHSLGALVALETLRELKRMRATMPIALIVSGVHAPQLPATGPPLATLSDQGLREHIARMGGTPPVILENDEIMELVLPTLRVDLQLFEDYRPTELRPLELPILALGGQTDERAMITELRAWQEVTTSRFACRTYPGGHFYLMSELGQVASAVNAWLAKKPSSLLSDDQVDLWLLPLDHDSDPAAIGCLSEAERQRADRFLRPRDRNRFVAARHMTRVILSRYLDIAPDAIRFVIGQHGKPELAADQGKELHFNVSHSGDLGLLAIGRYELGVDVEENRSDVDIDGIATRFYSRPERRHLIAQPHPQRQQDFFAIWAAKEAYCKARGLGLHLPTDTYSVMPAASSPWIVDEPSVPISERPSVYPIFVTPGFSAALASHKPVTCITVHDWSEVKR